MTEAPERYVRIAHEDGREYAVLESDFATAPVGPAGETYEALGFVKTRYDDDPAPIGEEPPAEEAPPS